MATSEADLDELLGAYALDAVDPDEARAVESYLKVNPRARDEVEGHREVAALLAFSGASAPSGLWDRISESLDEPAPPPGEELAKVLPLKPRRRWPAMVTSALAAAAVVAGAFLVGDALSDQGGQPPTVAEAYEAAVSEPGTQQIELTSEEGTVLADAAVLDNGVGYLAASTLPELGADRTYQLWGVVDGEVISLGVLGNRPAIEPFTAAGELEALVLTEEVAGGVAVSSQPALASGTVA